MMTGAALAQTNAPVRDYGLGFAKFYQLGLPDVTGGMYGKLEITQRNANASPDDSMYIGRRLYQLGLSGNGWKTKELGVGTNRYVFDAVLVVDVMDQKTFEAWQRSQQEEAAKASATQRTPVARWEAPPLAVGRWKAVDVRKDIAKVFKVLEGADENNRNVFQYDIQAGSELLLTAAQLYRFGMKDDANRIADRLFAMQRDQRQLIQGAIGAIAQEQYSQSLKSFRLTRDWAAWHKSLTDVLAKFSGSWPQASGVKKLADLVKSRVNQPEPPPLVGEGLTEEDQKLARRLAVEPSSDTGNYGYTWIFPPPHYRQLGQGAATNDAMVAIRNRGIGAVPMLAAMLKDNTLTMRDNGQGGMNYFTGIVPGRGQGEETETMFNSMRRPVTRGEIARSMVQPLLIVDDQRRGEMQRTSGDDLTAECEAWYKEYKGKSVDELAMIYMEKGDQNQRQHAMNYLMRGKSQEANRAEIEKMLLTIVKEATDTPYIVQQYVQQRREKASNFVEQVAVLMAVTNAPVHPGTATGAMRVRRPSRGNDGEAFVKQLRDMVSVRSVRDLLNEFISGTQSVAMAQMKLQEQLSREAPDESLAMLLETAQKLDDPVKRGVLMGMVGTLKYARPGGWDQMDPEALDQDMAALTPNKFDPTKHADIWNKMLEDRRGEGQTIREAAAWAIEALYAEEKTQGEMPYEGRGGEVGVAVLARFGERGQEMLVERACARLAGKPVSELPSAGKVDENRRRKMTDAILAAPDASAALSELNLNEQLALAEIGRTNKAINAKLRPLADGIVEVKIAPEFKTAAALDGKLKWRKFDRETVRALLDVSLQLTRAGYSFNASIARRPNVGGTVVTFSKPPVLDQGSEMTAYYAMMGIPGASTNRQVIGGVRGWLAGGRHNAMAWWPAKEPARMTVADASAGIEARLLDEAEAELRFIAGRQQKSEQDMFWDELDVVIEKTGVFLPLSVTLYGEAEKGATAGKRETGLPIGVHEEDGRKQQR
jgi:hypothetical protein